MRQRTSLAGDSSPTAGRERPEFGSLSSERLGFYAKAHAILDRHSFGRESGFQEINPQAGDVRNSDIRIDDPPSGLKGETVVSTGIKILAFKGKGRSQVDRGYSRLRGDPCGIREPEIQRSSGFPLPGSPSLRSKRRKGSGRDSQPSRAHTRSGSITIFLPGCGTSRGGGSEAGVADSSCTSVHPAEIRQVIETSAENISEFVSIPGMAPFYRVSLARSASAASFPSVEARLPGKIDMLPFGSVWGTTPGDVGVSEGVCSGCGDGWSEAYFFRMLACMTMQASSG